MHGIFVAAAAIHPHCSEGCAAENTGTLNGYGDSSDTLHINNIAYIPDVVQEIKACSVLYKNNFCEGNIVPHMFQPCGEWETCMNRDPSKIGRARIGAQLLAEIVNAFVENISWKTFVSILVTIQFICRSPAHNVPLQFFSVVSLAFFTLFINSLFTFYRSKHYQVPHPAPVPVPQPQLVMPPQTPRRGKPSFRWNPGDGGDDVRTPTRRRRLDDGAVTKIKGN